VVDYGYDYTNGVARTYGKVSYAQLRSGEIEVAGKKVPTSPLSSLTGARKIAETLKSLIQQGKFHLGEPVDHFPTADFSFDREE
jgi:uncharacterized protein (DUF39 family)